MPKISIVKLSEVEKDGRFDAEFYKPEYLITDKKFSKIGYEIFEKVFLIVDGPFGSDIHADEYTKEGIPFIRTEEISPVEIDESKVVFISPEKHKSIIRSEVKFEDVLLTKTGVYYGIATVFPKELAGSKIGNIRADLAKIRIRNHDEFNPYFLSFFLNSNLGYQQTRRFSSGMSRPRATIDSIKKMRMPKINIKFQNKIEGIFFDIKEKLQTSKTLYKEAEEILLKELGLLNYSPKHKLTFEANLKEVIDAERIDADYFQPKYKEIEKRIEEYNGGFDILDNLVKKKKGIEVGSDEYFDDGDKPFYRVSDISINGFSESPKKISKELYQKLKKDFEPKKGEILFTKDGTLGITYLLDENIEGILSGAFLRLQSKTDFNKECLTLILNSILCKGQIEKSSGGALISHLKPSEAMNLKIPLLPSGIQNKISEKIQESFILRKESKELLEKAKKMVEDEIEREAKKESLR